MGSGSLLLRGNMLKEFVAQKLTGIFFFHKSQRGGSSKRRRVV